MSQYPNEAEKTKIHDVENVAHQKVQDIIDTLKATENPHEAFCQLIDCAYAAITAAIMILRTGAEGSTVENPAEVGVLTMDADEADILAERVHSLAEAVGCDTLDNR